jgi:hypothetical protein
VELRHLRYFVAVAEMENVSRATRILEAKPSTCLAKPALYKRDLADKKQTKDDAEHASRAADIAAKSSEAICRLSNRYATSK